MARNTQIESQPLLDFCDSRLGTTVSSDKISSDGYEVDNLISVEFWKKQNGFMSERFIKPPINLTFHFPCPIAIWRIIVDPVVGSQKSSSIGIVSTSSGNVASKEDTSTDCQSVKKGKSELNVVEKSLASENDVSRQQTFSRGPQRISGTRVYRNSETFIGKIDMLQPAKICFHDSKNIPSTSVSGHQDLNSFKYCGQLRHVRQVYNASHITVRICQTLSGSVGAVKSVEIWGKPTKWCDKDLVEKVYERYKCGVDALRNSYNKSEVRSQSENSVHHNEIRGNYSVDLCTERRKILTVEIPDEFLDPLSCEIMTIPMLLPSGRNIDKTSLDKFIDIEASWGRQPSDPFTGVAFTAKSFPIPNDALKGRIDHFLISNETSSGIQTLPRTASTVYQKQAQIKRKQESEIPTRSDKKLKSGMGTKEDHVHTISTSHSQPLNISPSNTPALQSSDPPGDKIVSNGHEDNLHNSLNTALSSVLENFPSFRKRATSNNSTKVSTSLCGVCKIDLVPSDLRYELRCKHLLCRHCLLNIKTIALQCKVCDQITSKQDIARTHR